MRLVRTGGPYLLPVDHPLIAAELRSRHRTGHVGAAARLAEQLAPDILAGEDAQQESLLLQIGAVREDGGGGERADADLGDADGADALEFLLDHRNQADGKVAAVPARRPMRDAPSGFGKFETPFHQPVIRAPICFQPSAGLGTDGIFVDLGHRLRPRVFPRVFALRPPSSAASVRGDSWHPPAKPRSFWPA